MRRMRTRLVLNAGLGVAVLAAAAAGATSLRSSTDAPILATARVTRGVVLASVSATGNVTSARQLSLNFSSSGVLTEVDVKPGDRVQAGQVLAKIDDRAARNDLAVAQANLAKAEADLSTLLRGLTPAERTQNQVTLDQARAQAGTAAAAVKQAQDAAAQNAVTLQAAVDQAGAQLDRDQAARAADATQLSSDQTQLVADQGEQSAAQAGYDSVSARVSQDQADQKYCADNPSATSAPDGQACSNVGYQLQLDQAAQQAASARLNAAKQAVAEGTAAVSAGTSKLAADDVALANDADQLTNARNSRAAGTLKDQQAIASAQDAASAAELNVRATIAGNAVKAATATPAAVAGAQASLASAQAAANAAQQAVDGTTLLAPVTGTVASVANGVGETPGGGTVASDGTSTGGGFIVLTDLGTMQVAAGFSEADAAKVQLGQVANVTFDALPSERAAGRVTAIDTNSTVVSNVVTYQVTVALTQAVAGLKPGMTATVQAVVAERDRVLKVPAAAITTRGDASAVRVLEAAGSSPVLRTVVVGLKGDDAAEVVSGLREGERVVIGAAADGAENQGGGGGGGEGGGGGDFGDFGGFGGGGE